MVSQSTPILDVQSLDAFYGDFQALHKISLSLAEGQITAIIGANGAGKTTLLRAISGTLSSKAGRIVFLGRSIVQTKGYDVARAGIAMVPEGRLLYPSLSVEENLLMGTAAGRSGSWTTAGIYELFPALKPLRHMPSTSISGGQQQMVAIGRALLSNPRILLCDEISLGLAPKVIDEIYGCFDRLIASGLSIILVEQDLRRALGAASSIYCLLEGRVSLVRQAQNADLAEITRAYFGT